jgi:hypothetical protein
MTGSNITGCFIVCTILGIAIYDLFALIKWGVPGTISGVIRKINEKWPLLSALVAFAMGCLYGHFFL